MQIYVNIQGDQGLNTIVDRPLQYVDHLVTQVSILYGGADSCAAGVFFFQFISQRVT